MRIYLPATLPMLAAALQPGVQQLPGGRAFAVTAALREWYASGDSEELEYAALSLAAQGSLQLLATDPGAPRRRVVVAADVEDSSVTVSANLPGSSRGSVMVTQPVPLSSVAAAHVDGQDAVAAVSAASSDPGDEFAAEDAAAHELLWYATQELAELLRGLMA